MICEAAEDVLTSDGFYQITVGTLEKIAKEDRLEAEELKIFQACIKWAEVQCERLGVEVSGAVFQAALLQLAEQLDMQTWSCWLSEQFNSRNIAFRNARRSTFAYASCVNGA